MTELQINHFDLVELRAFFHSLLCPKCGKYGAMFIGPGADAYAAIQCFNCGAHIAWMSKPRPPVQQQGRRSRRPPLPRIGTEYCWVCLRDETTLHALGLRLERPHRRDRAALKNAGLEADEPEEFLPPTCQHCHSLIDWVRRTIGRMTDMLNVAQALTLPATGIERPALDSPPAEQE